MIASKAKAKKYWVHCWYGHNHQTDKMMVTVPPGKTLDAMLKWYGLRHVFRITEYRGK